MATAFELYQRVAGYAATTSSRIETLTPYWFISDSTVPSVRYQVAFTGYTGVLTVDWGDGTTTDYNVTSSNSFYIEHTYTTSATERVVNLNSAAASCCTRFVSAYNSDYEAMSISYYDFNATPNLAYFSLGGENFGLSAMNFTPVSNSLTYLSLSNTGLLSLIIPSMPKLEQAYALENHPRCEALSLGATPKLITGNFILNAMTGASLSTAVAMPALNYLRIQGKLPLNVTQDIIARLDNLLGTRTNGTATISVRHQTAPAIWVASTNAKTSLESKGWIVEVDEYQYIISNTTSIRFDITPSYAGEEIEITIVGTDSIVRHTKEVTTTEPWVYTLPCSKTNTYHVYIYGASISGVKLTLDGGSKMNLFMNYLKY